MRTKLIIGIVAAALILLALGGIMLAQYGSRTPSGSTQGSGKAIVLTAEGFEPATLDVQAGDTVTFTTTAGKPFWPASDLHPSHLLYPEFDPQRPVQPDASWSFTFQKPGSWRYHDHLAPYFTGTVTVSPKE